MTNHRNEKWGSYLAVYMGEHEPNKSYSAHFFKTNMTNWKTTFYKNLNMENCGIFSSVIYIHVA
jgi:hypothetical protein